MQRVSGDVLELHRRAGVVHKDGDTQVAHMDGTTSS